MLYQIFEDWLSSNDGLPSRFPILVDFEVSAHFVSMSQFVIISCIHGTCCPKDFTVAQLRAVFLGLVQGKHWRLEKPPPSASSGVAAVDVASLAARRLARRAGKKGFGNARAVRVYFEQSLGRANDRMVVEQVVLVP